MLKRVTVLMIAAFVTVCIVKIYLSERMADTDREIHTYAMDASLSSVTGPVSPGATSLSQPPAGSTPEVSASVISQDTSVTTSPVTQYSETDKQENVKKNNKNRSKPKKISGWVKKKVHGEKRFRFYVKGKYLKGLKKVKGRYYYFEKNGYMKTGTAKNGKWIYYCSKSGAVTARRNGEKCFYADGKKMTYADNADVLTQIRAHRIADRTASKKMAKSARLIKCFRWVIAHPYVMRRKFNGAVKYWPAMNADDIFVRGGGDCHGDGSAMAYLAAAIGYKDTYVCRDTASASVMGHSWAEVNGRVCDPLFAEARSFSANYYVPYSRYYGRALDHIKIPRYSKIYIE